MFNMPIGFCSNLGHVTNASIANFPYINVLPMMMTNYGGDLQLTTIEPYSGYNTSILFNTVAQQTYGTPGFTASPYMTADLGSIQQAGVAMAQATLTPIYNQYASQNINTACAVVDNAIKAYEAKIANADTPADQKAILEQAVKDLKAKKEELEKMKSDSEMDPGEAYSKSRDLKAGIDALIKEVNSKISGSTTPAAATGSDASASSAASSSSDAAAASDNSSSSSDANDHADNSTPTQGGSGNIDEFSSAVEDDTTRFFDAVNGIGTKNGQMKEVLNNNIGNGTMLELMLCWNEKYSSVHGESFIEAFMDDADHGQAREFLPLIVDSLVKRAKALGVYDQNFKSYVDALNKEIYSGDSWGWFGALKGMNDETVCSNIDAMLAILAAKTGSQYGAAAKQQEN